MDCVSFANELSFSGLNNFSCFCDKEAKKKNKQKNTCFCANNNHDDPYIFGKTNHAIKMSFLVVLSKSKLKT